MIKKLRIILSVFVLLSVFFQYPTEAVDSLQYALCKQNIKDAKIIKVRNEFLVNIQLSDTATEEFAELAGHNIGNRLMILIDDFIVTSAIVKAKIDSGSMASYTMTEADAQKLLERLNNAPTAPCGYIK